MPRLVAFLGVGDELGGTLDWAHGIDPVLGSSSKSSIHGWFVRSGLVAGAVVIVVLGASTPCSWYALRRCSTCRCLVKRASCSGWPMMAATIPMERIVIVTSTWRRRLRHLRVRLFLDLGVLSLS